MQRVLPKKLNPPYRILLGPGPSNLHPSVKQAMLEPMVSHMDPYFYEVMDDTMTLLRHVFRTKNELTFPISGSGTAGMEAGICNLIEPGDTVIVGVSGYFSGRMVPAAEKCGAKVVRVEAEWGKIVDPDTIEAALRSQKRVKLLGITHAETSTGILQPLREIAKLAKEYETTLLVDAVASLGGHEIAVDDWGIDICFSGAQKCLSAPPGVAPFTANQAVRDKIKKRTTPVPSLYLDLELLSECWLSSKKYHHTLPIYLVYALHEALRLVTEEGLDNRVARHLRHGSALQAGLEAMGLSLFAERENRMKTLTSIRVPSNIDDQKVRSRLLDEFGIEIGAGFGSLKGKLWRIGLMGYNSKKENLLLVLSALEQILLEEGFSLEPGSGVFAASQVLSDIKNRGLSTSDTRYPDRQS